MLVPGLMQQKKFPLVVIRLCCWCGVVVVSLAILVLRNEIFYNFSQISHDLDFSPNCIAQNTRKHSQFFWVPIALFFFLKF